MNKQAHILFTSTFSTSFIREDLSFLRKHYEMTEILSPGFFTILKFLRKLPKTDTTFSWFASVYASILVLLTKVFHKKSIIVLGGVDVAKLPELQYGIWNSRFKSIIVRYGIRNADIILAVDESLKRDAIRLAQYDGTNIHVVPTGYNSTQWNSGKKKEKYILTVAQCVNLTRMQIKGIPFLLNVAAACPEQTFILIGLSKHIAQQLTIPTNLHYIESIPQNELLDYYQKAPVYFQPSMREGLPNSLCEAMLCECYPVGTNVGGIPTAIGTTGSIIEYGNIAEAVSAIHDGLKNVNNSKSRERIATLFTKTRREEQLISHITSLLNAK